jgi:hypothetical protein
MRLLDALKTLTWNSLRYCIVRRPKLRRHSSDYGPGFGVAAEVCEPRTLLSASANLSISANGAIQLTSNTVHNESIQIDVTEHGGTVSFDVVKGKLHDSNTNRDFVGGQTCDVQISQVKSINVNLGGGYDAFFLNGLNTTGNVTFTGPGGGMQTSDGWLIQISSLGDAPQRSSIGGSIIANLGTSSLYDGSFVISPNSSGTLTVNGNISVTGAINSSAVPLARIFNSISEESHGNLVVGGDVNFHSSGSRTQINEIQTRSDLGNSFGNVTINGNVNFSSSGTGDQTDVLQAFLGNLPAGPGGSVTVRKNVTINDSGTGSQFNCVSAGPSGVNFTVAGDVVINSTGATQNSVNQVQTGGAGDLTVGSVSINSSGSAVQRDEVLTLGAGHLVVNRSVGITSSGSGAQTDDLKTGNDAANGSLTIMGAVTINDSGTGTQYNELFAGASGANLTVAGMVTINSTLGAVDSSTSLGADAGNLSTGAVIINSSGPATQGNELFGLGTGNLTIGTVTIKSSGAKQQFNDIVSLGSGDLTVNGAVSMSSSGAGAQLNIVHNDGTGNFTVKGSVWFTDSGSGAHTGEVWDSAGGNLSVQGPAIFHDSGSGSHEHLIYTSNSSGATYSMTVGGISVADSGAGMHDDEIISSGSGGTVTVNGSVDVIDMGTGANRFFVTAGFSHLDKQPVFHNGAVQINGNVSYDNHLNTTGGDTVGIGGAIGIGSPELITGDVTLNLASSLAHGDSVQLGLLSYAINGTIERSKSLVIGGALTIQSGAGIDQIDLWAIQVKGLLTLNSGTGIGDEIDIEGCDFAAAAKKGKPALSNTITMSGTYATLLIADAHGHGWDPTYFASQVLANMPGKAVLGAGQNDVIQLDRSNDGVTFNQQLVVKGASPKSPAIFSSGALLIDGPVVFRLNGVVQAGPTLTHWVTKM